MPTASSGVTKPVAVFGGTGFLGRRIVRHLRDRGVTIRIATRHPERGRAMFPESGPDLDAIRADANEGGSVAAAVADCFAVVNAISLYVERGTDTFQSVHVDAAARVARLAAGAGVDKVVHISGIGADARSPSRYIRSRGEGEAAVLRAFPSAALVRPGVMFGADDTFLAPLLAMLNRLPAFPLFGSGETRLQPVHVEDVAEAVARILALGTGARAYELAGPRLYTYRSLLHELGRALGKQPLLLPVPFALWHVIGTVGELLPVPPITRSQVELMEGDNIASPGVPRFEDLQMTPGALEDVLPQIRDHIFGARS